MVDSMRLASDRTDPTPPGDAPLFMLRSVASLALLLGAISMPRPPHASPPQPGTPGGLTSVPGITVGHHTLTERPTGCTVILATPSAVGGVDVRGSAPGTRET